MLPALLEGALWAVATAIAIAAATWAAVFHRTGFIDLDRTAINLLAVEAANGGFAFWSAAHGDKGKAAGAIGCAIHHDFAIGDGAELFESVLQVDFGGLEREISNEESHSEWFRED